VVLIPNSIFISLIKWCMQQLVESSCANDALSFKLLVHWKIDSFANCCFMIITIIKQIIIKIVKENYCFKSFLKNYLLKLYYFFGSFYYQCSQLFCVLFLNDFFIWFIF